MYVGIPNSLATSIIGVQNMSKTTAATRDVLELDSTRVSLERTSLSRGFLFSINEKKLKEVGASSSEGRSVNWIRLLMEEELSDSMKALTLESDGCFITKTLIMSLSSRSVNSFASSTIGMR